MVGLIPLFAVETLEPELLEKRAGVRGAPGMVSELPPRSRAARVALGPAGPRQAPPALAPARASHEETALAHARSSRNSSSTYGVRALSKVHEREPYVFKVDGIGAHGALRLGRVGLGAVRRQLQLARPDLVPGELPDHRVAAEVSSLLRRRFSRRVPDRLRPAATSMQIADELATRLERLFLKDEHGLRPVLAQYPQMQSDPHFRDYVLFYEYFYGDQRPRRGCSSPDRLDRPGCQAPEAAPAGARRPAPCTTRVSVC